MKTVKLVLLLITLMFFSPRMRSQTVYVSEYGKKFHKKNCDLAKTGKKSIDLKEAKKQGYEACKQCKPGEAMEPRKKSPVQPKAK
jgi:hypothetical protein